MPRLSRFRSLKIPKVNSLSKVLVPLFSISKSPTKQLHPLPSQLWPLSRPSHIVPVDQRHFFSIHHLSSSMTGLLVLPAVVARSRFPCLGHASYRARHLPNSPAHTLPQQRSPLTKLNPPTLFVASLPVQGRHEQVNLPDARNLPEGHMTP